MDSGIDAARQAPAQLGRLEQLVEDGTFTDAQLDAARRLIISPTRLAGWFDRGLLLLGVGLSLAGVFFFFAYNWSGMHRLVKLGLIELLMVAGLAVAATFWERPERSTERLYGKLGLLSSSAMVGVFLAVYGQVYQTGADAWQLFAAWSALTLVWTVLSRLQAAWALWLAVTHVAILSLWAQVPGLQELVSVELVTLGLAGVDVALLLVREQWRTMWRSAWLQAPWGRRALTALAVVMSAGVQCVFIMDSGSMETSTMLIGTLTFCAVTLGLTHTLWTRARDVGALALVGLGVASVGFMLLADLLVDAMDEWALFPLGFYVIVAVGALVTGLNKLRHHADSEEGAHV